MFVSSVFRVIGDNRAAGVSYITSGEWRQTDAAIELFGVRNKNITGNYYVS